MSWSLGFGLERIGLLALRFPRVATLLLLGSIVLAAMMVPKLGFDGDVVNVLDPRGQAFREYQTQSRAFHDYTKDLVAIIKHRQLTDLEVFEELRNLHLDLALEEGVQSVYSVFSIGEAAAEADSEENLLPAEFTSTAEVQESLQNLLQQEPAARAIIAPAEGAMLLMVSLHPDDQINERVLGRRLDLLRSAMQEFAPVGTGITFSGMPQIRVSIFEAIVSDQTRLTASGIALGCLVAWLIFGTVRSALICSVPALTSVLWILAVFAASNNDLSIFTTALPSLALIIAFADSIVLYFRWQAFNGSSASDQNINSRTAEQRQLANLARAVRQVGPASSLTSITTALAFGSFIWADHQAMDQFAMFGVIAVAFAFLAVITGLPLAAYWAVRLAGADKRLNGPRFTNRGRSIARFATASPNLVMAAAIGCLSLFTWAHTQLNASYTFSEYFPDQSEIRSSEAYVDRVFGGSAQYYVVLPVTAGGSFIDNENRQRLIDTDNRVADVFGRSRTLSLAAAWQRMSNEQILEIPEKLDEAPPSVRGRFISTDKRLVQIAATTSSGDSTLQVDQPIQRLEAALSELPYADQITITGLRVLMARSFPVLIEQLRSGLLISIFLAVLVVAVATRSLSLAMASLIPNLLPILFAESAMWFFGASLSVMNVVALTIAFGISIDNAVHVINAYQSQIGRSDSIQQTVRDAVSEIAPALIASTCIICVAASITQFSALPNVAEIGLLLIATLAVALISNLLILPSAIIMIDRLRAGKKLPSRSVKPPEQDSY
ncbi:MAG: MMPL family transporter [Gammaproteobacteria bacterium]|nr:MMPL family transporter [Gammaproteobacteria bacterium]